MATPKPESDDCMREEEDTDGEEISCTNGTANRAVKQKDKYRELRKLAATYSPKSRRKVEKVIVDLETTTAAKSISILMTGKTGSGKSTLTNGILGLNFEESAKEGTSIKARCTTEVTNYHKTKNGIEVTIWDSPGLQDGTDKQGEYLKQMKAKCSKVDLTMYCIRVVEARFVRGHDNPDVVAMEKLTETLSIDFWKNTIIVLTYANTLEAFHVEWEDLKKKQKAEAFNAKILEWEEQIKEIMIKDISVPKEIVDKIKVVPAGHCRKQHLPGVEYWLSNLWFQCLSIIPTKEGKLALVQINEKRFKREGEVTKDDFKKAPEDQPIVVTTGNVTKIAVAGGVGGSAAGGGIGALIGGLVAGPIGLAVGATIGALLGAAAGAGTAGGIASSKKK